MLFRSAVQVILGAIANSDGTRKGVRDAVFGANTVQISANNSVLGKAIQLDPLTGDVNAKDITIEVVKNKEEVTVQAWAVK